jgi:hypothetical protein
LSLFCPVFLVSFLLISLSGFVSSQSSTACYRECFTCLCVVFIVCNMSFIVFIALCAVFCLSIVCNFVRYAYFCVLCLIVLPLRPAKIPFAVHLNNNKYFIYSCVYSCLVHLLISVFVLIFSFALALFHSLCLSSFCVSLFLSPFFVSFHSISIFPRCVFI